MCPAVADASLVAKRLTRLAPTSAPAMGETYAHPTRQQLTRSAAELSNSLEQLQTADSWRQYLELNAGQALSAEQLSQSGASNEQLVEVLRHFDATNRQATVSTNYKLAEVSAVAHTTG